MSELEALAKQGREHRPEPKPPRPVVDKANRTSPAHAMLKLSPARGWYVLALACAWIVGCVGAFLIIVCSVSLKYPGPGPHPERQIIVASCIAIALFTPLALIVRRHALARGRVVYEADQAWIAAQPFTVTGYLETIGRHNWVSSTGSASLSAGPGTSASYYRVRVTLGFGAKPPDDQILRDALDGLGTPFTGDRYSGREFTFNGRYTAERNTRRVLRELVPAIHADYPLLLVGFVAEKT
jgi:hypothetical protein